MNVLNKLFLGEIQAGIPSPTPPPFRYEVNTTRFHDSEEDEKFMKAYTIFDLIRQDTTVVLVFPFLALMEHSLNAKQFSGAKSIDFSQELIAIGLAILLFKLANLLLLDYCYF